MREATRRRRRRTLVALGLVVAAVALTGAARPLDRFERRSEASRGGAPRSGAGPALRTGHRLRSGRGGLPGLVVVPAAGGRRSPIRPNIDVAVIALDRSGRPRAVANVLLSRDYPEGVGVPIDDDLGTDAVRWRRWNPDRWNGGTFSETDGSRGLDGGMEGQPAVDRGRRHRRRAGRGDARVHVPLPGVDLQAHGGLPHDAARGPGDRGARPRLPLRPGGRDRDGPHDPGAARPDDHRVGQRLGQGAPQAAPRPGRGRPPQPGTRATSASARSRSTGPTLPPAPSGASARSR